MGVDGHVAGGALEIGEPLFAGVQRKSTGHKKGAGVATGEDAGNYIFLCAVGDEDATTGFGGDPCSGDFGYHTSDGRGRCRAPGHGFDFGGDTRNHGDNFPGARHINQAWSGGQNEEVVRMEQTGEHG